MKIAIVGCGGIARATAQVACQNKSITVAAVCDSTVEGAQNFIENTQYRGETPRAYGDYTAMLDHETPDAVYLAVPHALHHPMMVAAIQRGMHIWCEKPITISVEEGKDIAQRAQQAGIKIGVNYQARYDPNVYRMMQAARSGDLGEIFYARSNTPYHRTNFYYAGWHASKQQAGGGTMLTVGSHHLDAILWACDSAPKSAVAKIAKKRFKDIEVEDLAMGILELENGVLIDICSSMVATPERHPTIELYGETGTWFYPGENESPYRFLRNMARSLEGFRAWVEEGIPYRCPPEEAIKALTAVEMLYQAAVK